MLDKNIILATDAYKVNHWNQYPPRTTRVYSYLESRTGAAHPYTQFFGLQYILKRYLAPRVTEAELEEAHAVTSGLFGGEGRLNDESWRHIITAKDGHLPLRIKAAPEGLVIPTGNVLVTIENTDSEFYWLTNYVESILLHVWYPTTVATRSYAAKQMLGRWLDDTAAGNRTGLNTMLHDFGYRGVSSDESAAMGGAAHLVNFRGTDTIPGMRLAKDYYAADLATLAGSVPATEHSVMTSMGEDGEHSVIQQLLDNYPDGVLSVVNDSFDYRRHVDWLCSDFREQILARDGVFVTRPDSYGPGESPASVVLWIADRLKRAFGGHPNVQGNWVLDPHVRILWGDGIEMDGIEQILKQLALHGFSAENVVFGMGGGLLQKINRDTERFSIKSSAQERDGVWHDISKNAPGKVSKRGKLALVQRGSGFQTVALDHLEPGEQDLLETVYEDGEMAREYSFDEVRANAER